ncbi:MAG: DUF871 domain-containing protein [Culicoidibacterales bacterium]
MKRQLGIAIYPEKTTLDKDMEYIKKAASCGFTRVFTCLLSAEKTKEELAKIFKMTIGAAKSEGMEVILDIAPAVFKKLEIDYSDLTFFHKLGATGIRLDLGFDGLVEANLTQNEYDLDIEINMSNDTAYLDNILSYAPNKDKILGCHNFYPQSYTGLDYDHFISCSKRFKKQGIRTAAFITSDVAQLGPWDINDGLCTLEMHRNMAITTQAKHLWATGLIDDIIIGNAYASDEQLEQLGKLNRQIISLDVHVQKQASEIEKIIMFDNPHVRRGDISAYMIRSTPSRKKYSSHQFPPHYFRNQEKGDIIIGNDTFGKYKGELQLILAAMPLDERKNICAVVVEHEQFLLDYIGAWSAFKLNAIEK